ncbi:PepSY domain-containing protein [Methanothermobacter wolfeii]|uniref:PepSY domain-containing protein n=1 Tax=Methanothermobacter wolfeii TaxID=145261 RepID=UPI0024B392B2|nr:PepSY domain-containing protein [Methanothermobacter wolfeii]MDI6702578.1 PepSY domain-containing protein [Methanothermobacter wolfeii]
MINSKILASVAIVLIIGAVAAGYQVSQNSESLWKFANPQGSSNPNPTEESSVHSESPSASSDVSGEGSADGSGGDSGMNVKVSSSEAKKIAQSYIKQEGAVAGTPRLVKMNGKTVYLVPIEMNGKTVGEIYIDPITGKNLGGAGGAP